MSVTRAGFNPSGDPRVAEVKAKTEELIAIAHGAQQVGGGGDPRCAAIAATKYEEACMWLVKSLTAGK